MNKSASTIAAPMSVPPSMSKSAKAKEPSGKTGACENVVTPLEAIAIASVSEAEPILPALGITIFLGLLFAFFQFRGRFYPLK